MKWIRSISQIGIGIGIIGVSILISIIIFAMRSDVKKVEPEPEATLVEVIESSPSTERIKITAYGTVQPKKQTVVHPEVTGSIVQLSDDLKRGGRLGEGQILLMIDPRDFEIGVTQAEAEVARAEFELRVEEGQQLVAAREWELLHPSIKESGVGTDLVLRKPHLLEKQAALKSAESRLEKAKIDLQRTILYSPFPAIVLEENVEEGQYITPQTEVATLAGTDVFEVQVSIPYDNLRWIDIPKNGGKGSEVVVSQNIGGGRVIERKGHIVRLLGDLDAAGRLARLIVAVDDPLGLKSGAKPLLLRSYVRVDILGPEIKDVYRIPRTALHEGNTLWIKNDQDKLEFRKVTILFSETEDIIIDEGLQPGEKIIVSPLPLAIPGMDLRTQGGEP
jgi:RND family efflux transporter MFP subunit